jgi:hypothetical protein
MRTAPDGADVEGVTPSRCLRRNLLLAFYRKLAAGLAGALAAGVITASGSWAMTVISPPATPTAPTWTVLPVPSATSEADTHGLDDRNSPKAEPQHDTRVPVTSISVPPVKGDDRSGTSVATQPAGPTTKPAGKPETEGQDDGTADHDADSEKADSPETPENEHGQPPASIPRTTGKSGHDGTSDPDHAQPESPSPTPPTATPIAPPVTGAVPDGHKGSGKSASISGSSGETADHGASGIDS